MAESASLSENLYPYLFYQDLVELQAVRDADVTDRILNPERESFTRELLEAIDDVCIYQLVADGSRVIERSYKNRDNLKKTITNIENRRALMATTLGPEGEISEAEIMVNVVNELITSDLSESKLREAIICLGVIGAHYKPPQGRLAAIWEATEDRRAATPSTDDSVYRCAINVLEAIYEGAFDWNGEEQTIERNLDTFKARLTIGKKVEKPSTYLIGMTTADLQDA